MQHMATWSGVVSEETAPFSETSKHNYNTESGKDVWDGTNIVYPAGLCYGPNETVLQESIVYFHPQRDIMKQTVTVNGKIKESVDMVSVTDILEEHELTDIKFISTSTAASTTDGTITPSDAVIKAGGTDVTANYDITYEPGILTVKKEEKPSGGGSTDTGDGKDDKSEEDKPKDDKSGDDQGKKDDKSGDDQDKKSAVKYYSEWVNGKWYSKDGSQTYRPTAEWKKDKKGYKECDAFRDGWYYFRNAGYAAQG